MKNLTKEELFEIIEMCWDLDWRLDEIGKEFGSEDLFHIASRLYGHFCSLYGNDEYERLANNKSCK